MKNLHPIPKSIYYLCFFCLIPFIGILSGFVILMYGFIKFNKRKIIFIGAMGIVFSILSSFLLLKYLVNNSNSKNALAALSQKAVNSLVVNIEFYKKQHGNYPDSLVQLHESDKMAPLIEDPILIWNKSKVSTKFNYEKIGDKYKLFSSGIDCIANTKDDIYPSININSSNFGLVK